MLYIHGIFCMKDFMESPKLQKGPLFQKFECALNLTIEKFAGYIKLSCLKKSYNKIYEKEPLWLKKIHHQLQVHLIEQMKKNAVALCIEQNVSFLLNSFEKVIGWIQQNNLDEIEWEQTGISEANTKEEYRDKLKHYLQKLSSENDDTENQMFKNHEEILDLKECIIDLKRVLFGLLDDLASSSIGNL